MTERLEFRYSREGQLALMVVAVLLITGGSFVGLMHGDVVYRTIGWFGAAFFFLCLFIAVKRWLAGGVPFVFDLGGISFPSGTVGVIPWSEIHEFAIVTVRRQEFLALTFANPERVLVRVPATKRRLALANQRLGWGHWALSFNGLTPGIGEAVAFIREHTQIAERGN